MSDKTREQLIDHFDSNRCWVEDCVGCKAIRSHLENPVPRVSREQISDIIDREYRDAEYRSDKYPHGPESYDVKAMVAIVIREIFGIEVPDSEDTE